MKRLLLVPITAALLTVSATFAISPASAAPTVASCRPGVPVSFSASISPRIVHAGRPMTVSYSVNNCTNKTQTVVVHFFTTLPQSCGFAVGAGSGHFVLIHNSGVGGASGGQAPTCQGRFLDWWQVTSHGKVIARASAAYTVIK